MKGKIVVLIAGLVSAAVILVVLLFLLIGGESTREVVTRYQAEWDAKRAALAKLAGDLPPAGSVTGRRLARLDPPPFYDRDRKKEINCSVLMVEQLKDPDVVLRPPEQVDFNLHEGDLLMMLRWSGPKNPMSASVWEGRARPELEGEIKQVLGQPYMVVIRPVRYEAPQLIGEATFVGGLIDLEAFVYDWRSGRIEAATRAMARAEQNVSVIKGKDRDWIYSSMMTNARRELAKALAETTGGTFNFDVGR